MILSNPFYRRALVAVTAPLLAAALISVTAVVALQLVIRSTDQLVQEKAANLLEVERLRSAFEWKVASNRGFFLTRDPLFLARESDARTEFLIALSHLSNASLAPQTRSLLQEIDATLVQHELSVEAAKDYRRADNMKKTIEVFENSVWPKREKLRLAILALQKHFENLFEEAKRSSHASNTIAMQLMLGVSLVGLLIMSYLAFFMVKKLGNAYEQETHSRHRAESAVAIRDDFLAIASHELKTPLTPLKLHSELMLRRLNEGGRESGEDKVRQWVESTDRQVDRLIRLVEDLLDVSWLQQGKFKLQIEELDVVALVQDVVNRFCSPDQGVRCHLHVAIQGGGIIQADRYRIEQVVTNVISNAIKYGGGKPIDVHINEVNDAVELQIKDQGLGIARELQEKIFERFERAVEHTKIGGLGLGLYIARRILEIHGGTISVHSELGKGSTFIIRIPHRPPRDERRELT